MPHFSIIKFFDEALLPVVLVFGAKLFGVIVVNLFLQTSTGFDLLGSLFWQVTDHSETVFINSISSTFMFLALVVGFGWVVIKAHHFHDTHIHPVEAAKLHKKGWGHLIQDSYEIYHQAVIWFALLWFSFLLILTQSTFGIIYPWLVFIALIVTVSLTLLLWIDVKKELFAD